MAETAPEAEDGGAVSDGILELVIDLLAEPTAALQEPGVVFFVGAAVVFTLAWAYWYRVGGR